MQSSLYLSRPPTLFLVSYPHSFTAPSPNLHFYHNLLPHRNIKPLKIHCCAETPASTNEPPRDWKHRWVPKNLGFAFGFGLGPDKVFRSIAGATSSPISQFIPSPPTFLHSVDPRIKLVWLVVLVFLPARSHIYMRFGIVLPLALLTALMLPENVWIVSSVFLPACSHIYMRFGIVLSLALLTTLMLPENVWIDQLSRVTLLSVVLFIVLGLTADGAIPNLSWRTPPPSLAGFPSFPSSSKGYAYMLLKFGPLQMTRKGLSVASTSACLTFTILQSASLCLATTPPEQLAAALRWYLLPLAQIGVPVAEIVLTLMLSLRFINLIFDEVRNVALGLLSRRIDWQNLTFLERVDVFVMYTRRIFKNLFSHAEQISQAMIVRGFRGDSKGHKIHFANWTVSMPDFVSLLALCGVVVATRLTELLLV